MNGPRARSPRSSDRGTLPDHYLVWAVVSGAYSNGLDLRILQNARSVAKRQSLTTAAGEPLAITLSLPGNEIVIGRRPANVRRAAVSK